MMKDEDDEQWLKAFLGPLRTEYERQTAQSACIAPARFWQVACHLGSWSDADRAHLDSCVRCAEHSRKSHEAIVSRFGGVTGERRDFAEAEIALEAASRLPESNRDDSRDMLKQPVETKASQSDMSAPLEPPRPAVVADETVGPNAASGETVLSLEARREQALRMLSEEHRRLIQWRDVDGLHTDEVAQRLGWTRQQVVSRLPAARVQFHEALVKEGLIAPDAENAAEPTNASVASPPRVV